MTVTKGILRSENRDSDTICSLRNWNLISFVNCSCRSYQKGGTMMISSRLRNSGGWDSWTLKDNNCRTLTHYVPPRNCRKSAQGIPTRNAPGSFTIGRVRKELARRPDSLACRKIATKSPLCHNRIRRVFQLFNAMSVTSPVLLKMVPHMVQRWSSPEERNRGD